MRFTSLAIACCVMLAPVGAGAQSSAPAPSLTYAFSARITLAPPVEQGEVDGKRKRFIAITGGSVYGPRLQGDVLAGGGDWQAILPGGLTEIDTRYSFKTKDGTIIAIQNPGVRTATPEVIDRLAKGEDVDPSLYYFRTTPRFEVRAGPFDWLRRKIFVARGIRKPDHVVIDFYEVN